MLRKPACSMETTWKQHERCFTRDVAACSRWQARPQHAVDGSTQHAFEASETGKGPFTAAATAVLALPSQACTCAPCPRHQAPPPQRCALRLSRHPCKQRWLASSAAGRSELQSKRHSWQVVAGDYEGSANTMSACSARHSHSPGCLNYTRACLGQRSRPGSTMVCCTARRGRRQC